MCLLKDKQAFGLAAVIFTYIAVVHLIRIIEGWGANIDGFSIPMWVSWAALVLGGYLAYHFMSLTLAKKKMKR